MIDLIAEAGLQDRISVDSAGTAAHHVGERADPRSQATAAAHGIELKSLARQFTRSDFASFDYVIAMDQENLQNLQALAPADCDTLFLLRSFERQWREGEQVPSVPDPYYGEDDGFEEVFRICKASCRGLFATIRATL